MRYFGLILLFLAAGEVASIVLAADWLGGVPTLLLMLLSFGGGLLMLRHIGFSSVLLAGSLFGGRSGGTSLYQLLWPLRYVLAAILLMSPGFVSTLLALGLMLPIKAGPEAVRMGRDFGRRGGAGDVIDGDFQTVRPDGTEAGADRHLEERR